MTKRFKVVYYNSRDEHTTGAEYRCLLPELNAELVAWVKRHCTDAGVILINAAATLPNHWQPRLLAPFSDKAVTAVTALTTADYLLSPLPTDYEFKGKAQDLDALLSVLAPSQTYIATTYNPAIIAVADIDQLLSLDTVHVAANLLVQAEALPLLTRAPNIGDQHPLPAHPMATVQWLISQQQHSRQPLQPVPKLDYPLFNNKPNLLHVVMDWGGGIHQWITDFIENDHRYNHFVLVSKGEFYRRRYGEKYSLYYGGCEALLLAEFEITPIIETVAIEHAQYQNMLQKVLADYGITAVVVSSLIGHSMDCLSSGLPTLRVLHDYFPHWPSLDARLDDAVINQQAHIPDSSGNTDSPFRHVQENEVAVWQRTLNEKLSADMVQIVAPDQSVIDNISKLPASDCYQKAVLIPHGITALKNIDYQANKTPFTVLVLGRLIAGKGKQLLQQVMAQENLADVHWLLLGSGDDGDQFRDHKQVEVIKNYDREQLSEILNQYLPQLALMPARVSETFSYVLSELQTMALPTLATRVGALKNRIEDYKTGFLAAVDCDDLTRKIVQLKEQPDIRQSVHETLLNQPLKSLTDMTAEYQHLLEAFKLSPVDLQYRGLLPADIKAERLMRIKSQLTQLREYSQQLQQDVSKKTDWAKQLDQQIEHLTHNLKLARGDNDALQSQLKVTQQVHEQSIKELVGEMDGLNETLKELTSILNVKKAELQHLYINNQLVIQERDQARDLVAQMMASRSWRLTRPLRYMARVTRHFKNKTGYRFRQLLGLPKRVSNSLKTRGMKATWQLAKQKLSNKKPVINQKATAVGSDYQALTLATSKQPIVTVIIPVYNHFQHTYHCLKSISELSDSTPFEVLVVDDCSTDDTQELMSLISGVRYHRQAQNGGFIRTCNQGAKMAKGDYLLFLNNDTEVNDGWLDSLLETFSTHKNVGLVGSQLRYPDGRLQEAGGIVFNDASGWNYGRLESPEQPEVAHLRAVSYCSGASIMVPTALFKSLGYFDERFVPAYYEDTDLAFAVRAAGLRVLYQPRSRVIHFEGISSGTDLTSGVKKYQVINQQKFADKWQQALENQPTPGTAIEQARFQESGKRILIVDACTPTPDQDSGSLRMLNLIQILQELGFHVSFMPENMAHFGAYTEQLQQLGVECVYAPTYSSPVDYLAKKGSHFCLVVLSRYYVAQPLLKCLADYAPKAKLWFDTVDLHYLREQRMAELAANNSALKTAAQTKVNELAVAKACDLTLVVSPYEQSVLAEELPDLQVAVLSNIHEIYGSQKDYQERRDIVFMGGYQHTPNVDGICWFVTEIWPKIHASLPDVVLHIVGSKAPEKVIQLGQQPGIKFHGFVQDIAPMMSDVRIAVAPLRFGAGVKGKVNMSMSYGQPVVGTTVAVEGMYTQHGEDVLMADEADDFARQVIRLYQDQDLWQTLSAGGLANVSRYFSFNAAKRVIADLLQDLT